MPKANVKSELFPAKNASNDRRRTNLNGRRNSARAAGAASAADASCIVGDSSCFSGAVASGDDWQWRFVQRDGRAICGGGPRNGRKPSMASAHKRRRPALAKTAVALLAHYYLLKAFRHKGRSRPAPGRARGRRLGCLDFSHWGKAH